MRLQQQLSIIKRALPILTSIEWTGVPNGHGQQAADDKPAIRSALVELTSLPYFHEHVAGLLSFHTFSVGGEKINLDPNSHNQWHAHINPLLVGLRLLEDALKLAVPQADTHTIAFRLPETTSLGAIAETAKNLEDVLRPVLDSPDTQTKIAVQGFDTGSMWFVVALGSVAAYTIVNNICQAAQKILTLVLDYKRTRLSMKRMGIEEKMLEVVETRALVHQAEQTKALAEAIDSQEFPDQKDHERVLRIERSIKLLVKLNELGGEVRPAIEPVSPGPKEDFPDIAGQLAASTKELAAAEKKLLGPTDGNETKKAS